MDPIPTGAKDPNDQRLQLPGYLMGERIQDSYRMKSNDTFDAGCESAAKPIKVIGRLDDTAVAKDWDGHDVLNDPNWTIDKNVAWVQSGIDNNQIFYVASPMTPENLISSNPAYPGQTVFAQELAMLYHAGYILIGNYLYPPI